MLLKSGSRTAMDLRTIIDFDTRMDLFTRNPVRDTVERMFIRPPILADLSGDTEAAPIMVWGFGYTDAIQTLIGRNTADIPVLYISADDTNTPAADTDAAAAGERTSWLTVALYAEGRTGEYAWSEIDRILTLIEPNHPSDTVLNLIDSRRNVTELRERFRRLPLPVQTSLDDGSIDIRTAEHVPESLLPHWNELCDLIASVSFSERRQILRFISDFVRSGHGDAQDLVSEARQSAPGDLLETLRRRRYPTIDKLEDRLNDFKNSFIRGTGITVTYPRNYEGDYVDISFKVRSGNELHGKLVTLKKMEDHIDDLVGLLLTDA